MSSLARTEWLRDRERAYKLFDSLPEGEWFDLRELARRLHMTSRETMNYMRGYKAKGGKLERRVITLRNQYDMRQYRKL